MTYEQWRSQDFSIGGSKRGSEATEQGEGVGEGCPPSHGREIFWKFVYENGISSTLNDIIRG